MESKNVKDTDDYKDGFANGFSIALTLCCSFAFLVAMALTIYALPF